MAEQFRFLPRYRAVAWLTIASGIAFAIFTAARGGSPVSWAVAALGVGLGVLYLRSPTWRMAVTVDDAALEVGAPDERRFRLAWSEVVNVVASPSTHTCFVDGGDPARSLLVPGDGAPAPYDLERRTALYAAILAHVPRERVVEVGSLDEHRRSQARSGG